MNEVDFLDIMRYGERLSEAYIEQKGHYITTYCYGYEKETYVILMIDGTCKMCERL